LGSSASFCVAPAWYAKGGPTVDRTAVTSMRAAHPSPLCAPCPTARSWGPWTWKGAPDTVRSSRLAARARARR
jgi:hypothetical protein